MHRSIIVGVWALSMTLALPLAAQQSTTVVGKGPGVAVTETTVKVTAIITAIDQATREVSLKGPPGREVTVTAGPEVKNFAQMKVGDRVNVEYVEALALELKKGSTAAVGSTAQVGAGTAKSGARPAGIVGQQVTVTAEVVALDPESQTVTLRGPRRTVDLKVADPAQFKLVAKGDRVEVTYTEAIAIAVEPTKK